MAVGTPQLVVVGLMPECVGFRSFLYLFGVVEHELLYDVLDKLVARFWEVQRSAMRRRADCITHYLLVFRTRVFCFHSWTWSCCSW